MTKSTEVINNLIEKKIEILIAEAEKMNDISTRYFNYFMVQFLNQLNDEIYNELKKESK